MRNQRGSAVVIGAVAMLFFLLASAGLLPWISNEIRLMPRNQNVLAAQYVAEAGAKRAINEFLGVNAGIAPTWVWLGGSQNLTDNADGRSYSTNIFDVNGDLANPPNTNANGTFRIVSTGTVGNTTKVVSVQVQVMVAPGGVVNGNLDDTVKSGDGGITIGDWDRQLINGNLASTGDVTVKRNTADISGKIYSVTKPIASYPGTGWYELKSAEELGKISIDLPSMPIIPTMPTIPSALAMPSDAASKPRLPTRPGEPTVCPAVVTTLPGNFYYHPSNYTIKENSVLRASSGQSLTVYLGGGPLRLDGKSNGTSDIVGDKEINIYINGNMDLWGVGTIQCVNSLKTGQINIYATGNVNIGGTIGIVGDNINIYANNIALSGNGSIKASNALGLYARGTVISSSSKSIEGNSITVHSESSAAEAVKLTSSVTALKAFDALAIYTKGQVYLSSAILEGKSVVVQSSGQGVVLTSSAAINATDEISIYAKGQTVFDTSTVVRGHNITIQTDKADGVAISMPSSTTIIATNELSIYAKGQISLSGSAVIQGKDVTIQTDYAANDAVKMTGASSINKNLADGVLKIYSVGSVFLEGGSVVLGGKAGLIATKSFVDIHNVKATNVVLAADSGASEVTGTTEIAAVYSNGSLVINGPVKINENNQKDQVLQDVGLGGGGSGGGGAVNVAIVPNSWVIERSN